MLAEVVKEKNWIKEQAQLEVRIFLFTSRGSLPGSR